MFSTSGDILNLVLAVCITVLTVFLVMALYYVVSGVRKAFRLIDRIESGVSKAEELLTLVRDKVKSSSAYVMLFTEAAKQVIKIAKDNEWLYRTKKKEKKQKKS
ncbi:MAG: hypothetical protein WCZ15_01080 [Patescibacteria group bacterium]